MQFRNALIPQQMHGPSTTDVNHLLRNTEVRRGTFAPLVEYADGRVEPGWPEALPVHRLQRLMRGGATNAIMSPSGSPEMGQAIEDSLGVAGMAALGSVVPTRPANSLGMFAGPKAMNVDEVAFARAQAAEAAGTPREQIWNDTGWFRGADGNWRFEIDDSQSMLEHSTMGKRHDGRMGLLFRHEALDDAYPELGYLKGDVSLAAHLKDGGYYMPASSGAPRISIQSSDPSKARSMTLHELQHAIQDVEGHLQQSTPAFWSIHPEERARQYHAYRNNPSEIEARAAQARRDLTPEQRRARAPWLDYDVPETDQIVRR